MARLFFSLYITIIGAVFAIFFAIDYVSSKHYYNVEIEQISKSVEAYSVLFDQIHNSYQSYGFCCLLEQKKHDLMQLTLAFSFVL